MIITQKVVEGKTVELIVQGHLPPKHCGYLSGVINFCYSQLSCFAQRNCTIYDGMSRIVATNTKESLLLAKLHDHIERYLTDNKIKYQYNLV